ncbi:ATP-binding cassette domain-containing protein [Halovulum dunhuangense]|uniref:ATP-binding cassette domain-containing protein n=1 Tax=Halovulum dunhuangense TaxID=1505036 RepID=A0A849L0U1_9RHOB|nr:ATP-binding cassette domain-containing protein [Halovulum dunhuangense]NNU79896.1 ATP-binding cassette domain-containing protein [Halovulum dunhuangense]
MIEFRNVSKSFWTGKTRKVILDRASFSIPLGQSTGILAPNGTGKTTIINMMAGLEKADEGKIIRSSKISFPLGVVSGVNAGQTGQENARYIARLYGLDPDHVEAFVRYLVDIREYFQMPMRTYSQGMKSRYMFALMLSLEFDIYLIDEGLPSTMDAAFNRKAGAILDERLRRSTVVIVSHSPRILERYCTRAAVLRNGRLNMFDSLREAKEMYDYAA